MTDSVNRRRKQLREAQRRYRARHYERVRANEKRYRASAKGKAAEKIWKSSKAGKKSHFKACKKWMRSTPRGQRYYECQIFRLPASVPDSFLQSFRLMNALKQEIRNREYT